MPATALSAMSAERFREVLAELGVTQRAFAERAAVSFSVVNRWATGKIPVPWYVDLVVEKMRREEKDGQDTRVR